MASISRTESVVPENVGCNQESEVSFIKTAFPNRCRVISDVGEFSKVVTVQPENMDATIKFQLPAAYPSVIPEIAIRSESLTQENIADIRQILKLKAKKMIGQQMIGSLISEAESQLKALGLKPGKAAQINTSTSTGKQQQKKRKQKVKPKSEDEIEDKKLPSMKTADDVVKRIIWDDALEKDDFTVGYFDRFLGLVEQCFSAFSWEDLASADYNVLAVPKHRIQYFKYKDVKVWDKTRRIDNIFGSAEGTKTIDVIIKEIKELETLGQTHIDSSHEDTNSDNSSDDSLEVIIENVPASVSIDSMNKTQDYGKQRAVANPCTQHQGKLHNDCVLNHHKRPNYFVCVRITSQEVCNMIGKIQDDLIEKEPVFSECCIPGVCLHVTISTLGLDTPAQVSQCSEALTKMKSRLEAALPKSNLRLHGISDFRNHVVYAQVQHSNDFQEFCCLVKQILLESGIEIRDGHDFIPHMTIIKVTRPVARLRGTKFIDPSVYLSYKDTNFGEQKIDSIYLCSMSKERRDDGFYLTPLELHFNI